MKKLTILIMVAVFILSSALTVVSKSVNGQWWDVCSTVECIDRVTCEDGVCTEWHCCHWQYFEKGGCLWSQWFCVPIE